MKSRVIFGVFAFIVFFATYVAADENICVIADKLVMSTEAMANEIFDRNIKDRLFRGKGSINEVKGDSRSSYLTFTLTCGNDVWVTFEIKNAGIMDYQIGQKVSFSGRCIKMKKGIYRNTGGRYVRLTFDNANLLK